MQFAQSRVFLITEMPIKGETSYKLLRQEHMGYQLKFSFVIVRPRASCKPGILTLSMQVRARPRIYICNIHAGRLRANKRAPIHPHVLCIANRQSLN